MGPAAGDTHGIARQANPIARNATVLCVFVLNIRDAHLESRRTRSYQVTVNWTEGVRVWFRFLSVTFSRRVYWPGTRVLRGRSFSIVTWLVEAPGICPRSSVKLKILSLVPFLTTSYSTCPDGKWVPSCAPKL